MYNVNCHLNAPLKVNKSMKKEHNFHQTHLQKGEKTLRPTVCGREMALLQFPLPKQSSWPSWQTLFNLQRQNVF